MLTVVFGAGASYDCVPLADTPRPYRVAGDYQPPVAANLFSSDREPFNTVLGRYRDLGPIVNQIRRRVRQGEYLESILTSLAEDAATYSQRHRQLLAVRYYIRDVIADCSEQWSDAAQGATNYHELVDRIERWRQRTNRDGWVWYVTFNYDTLLDEALADRYRHGFTDLGDYVSHQFFRLLKLHGSSNWLRYVKQPDFPPPRGLNDRWVWEHAEELRETDEFVISAGRVPGLLNGLPVVPAIAVPTQEKFEFQCPPFMVNEVARIVQETKRLITIGWRGQEKHFCERWANRNGFFSQLTVCGSESDCHEAVRNMNALGISSDQAPSFDAGGFSAFLDGSQLETFLEAPDPWHR